MSKPTTKKPRLVEVRDPAEIVAIQRVHNGGDMNAPIGFCIDGHWWAEAKSLKDFRAHGSPGGSD